MTGKKCTTGCESRGAMLKRSEKGSRSSRALIETSACVIPHQANLRIMEAIADRLGIFARQNVCQSGSLRNTSAAAVAIALDEANRSGRIKRGDYVLMVVFVADSPGPARSSNGGKVA